MTEKKRSIWEEVWAELCALRAVRLEARGVVSLRESKSPQEVNAILRNAMASILTLAREGWQPGAEVYLVLAWEEYLRDEWAASLVPPFPLVGFANSTMLEKCWRAAEEEMRAGK